MCCKYNISALNVANITVSKRLKYCICNSTLSKLLQMQRLYFRDVANATHAPLVLQMPQYHPKLLQAQQWNVLLMLQMQQYICLSVANATMQTYKCCDCNRQSPSGVAYATTTLPEGVALATTSLSESVALATPSSPKVLRMQQYRLKTVANATV